MKDVAQVTQEIKKNIPKPHLFLYLIRECGFKRVAEVGVFGGNLTNRVLSNVNIERYYVVDPWKVYVESYDREPTEKETQQEYWDGLYNRLVEMQRKFQCINIMRVTSVVGAKELMLQREELDCVYLDGIHDTENIIKDTFCWMPLIKEGGVISGHDYIKRFSGMCETLDQIFEDDLNLMLMDPSKPPSAYKNTAQGGNWWVEVKGFKWKSDLLLKIRKMFPEVVRSIEEEWGEDE